MRAIGCPHDENSADYCGAKIGLQMKIAWRRLTYYPKYEDAGSSERYYRRMALLDRLPQVESAHNRIKSRNLGTAGAQRPRLREIHSYELLLQLAQCGLNALSLADQRQVHNVDPQQDAIVRLPAPPAVDDAAAAEAALLQQLAA